MIYSFKHSHMQKRVYTLSTLQSRHPWVQQGTWKRRKSEENSPQIQSLWGGREMVLEMKVLTKRSISTVLVSAMIPPGSHRLNQLLHPSESTYQWLCGVSVSVSAAQWCPPSPWEPPLLPSHVLLSAEWVAMTRYATMNITKAGFFFFFLLTPNSGMEVFSKMIPVELDSPAWRYTHKIVAQLLDKTAIYYVVS